MPLSVNARDLRAYAYWRGKVLAFTPDDPSLPLPRPNRDPTLRIEQGRIYVDGVRVGTVAEAVAECPGFDPTTFRWSVC